MTEQALFTSLGKHAAQFQLADAIGDVLGMRPMRHGVEVGAKPRQSVPRQPEIALLRGPKPGAHLFLVGTFRILAQVLLGGAEPRFERGRNAELSVVAIFAELTGDARSARARRH